MVVNPVAPREHTAAATPAQGRHGRLWRRVWRHRWQYAFLMPMLVLFVVFTIWPIVASWWYAFLEWPGYGPMNNYVGLDNFRRAFEDPLFWQAFGRTGIFALFGVAVQMPLALAIAVVLNNAWLRGRNVYRVLFFLPVVTTTAVMATVFVLLLRPTGGTLNEILVSTGVVDSPLNFLGSTTLALPTVLLIDLWKNVGVTIVYWLAALQTIPSELYEAAQVDGASRWMIFSRITVPLLVPLGLVISLLTFVSSLNAFDIVKVMTDGGPNRATDIVQTYIYRYAFDPLGRPEYGFASATGILFGLAVMAITALPVLARRRRQIGPTQARGKDTR